MFGSKIIDWAMRIITKGSSWKWPWHGNRLILRLSCLGYYSYPYTGSNGTGVEKDVAPSYLRIDSLEVKEFCLDDVWDPVHTTWRVTIPPFSTISVHSHTSVKGHCMLVHVLTEPMPGPQLPTAVVLTVTYGELHPGSSEVPISVHNMSTHSIKIPQKTGWPGCACQLSATGGPPDRDFRGVQQQSPKGMGLRGPWLPRPQGMAKPWAGIGQRTAAQIGTPVCLWQPGSG